VAQARKSKRTPQASATFPGGASTEFAAHTDTAALARALVKWYLAHRRDLPWRRTSDPYAIWLSEIMLQQTQVATVIPYYEKFLKHFPTVNALASAPLDDVLKLWAGLGYYSRARNLHRGAQTVVERFGGAVPASAQDIRDVPGIGAYTAGAILSIAYGLPEPLVDGNVARVFARLFLLKGDWRKNPLKDALWARAAALVKECAPARGNKRAVLRSGDLNQALMELGATVCTPANPQCLLCPVEAFCSARAKGVQDQYPEALAQKKSPVWNLTAWCVRDDKGRVLFAQRAAGGLFGGLWELPMEKSAAKGGGGGGRIVRHILTHRELHIAVRETPSRGWLHAALKAEEFACWSGAYTQFKWIAPAEALAGALALASVQQKLLATVELSIAPASATKRAMRTSPAEAD
jgi:A/G-specific adenine glycosylase